MSTNAITKIHPSVCPACGSGQLNEIYRQKLVPVQSCVLLDTMQAALDFPQAPLVLNFCNDCGFIFNSVFKMDLVDYALTTEESQHFSGTFNSFAKKLVAEIASLYDLRNHRTLEIGCGKGDFLYELVRQTETYGLGVDPGYIQDRHQGFLGDRVEFQRAYFDPSKIEISPDLIVCRHTLEHIPEVGEFIRQIADVVGQRKDVHLFFETPDVRRVLEEGAFWDIYYEHCSYFTAGSHARLFHREGFDITKLYLAYDDQYIIQHALPARGLPRLDIENDLEDVRRLAGSFPNVVKKKLQYWSGFLKNHHEDRKTIAIWGGGSKAVSFLTSNNLEREISLVVDINPFKQGKYLPVTGHQVVSPNALVAQPPDIVIVMNPVYLAEIKAQLSGLGLEPEIVLV